MVPRMVIQTSPRFLACLPFTLKEEGGYSNDAHDPGGKTMEGITQREYDSYRRSCHQPLQWVKLISDDEMHDIYFNQYWLPHCPALPIGLDLSFFDLCVNGGPLRAIVTLQRALSIHDDGQWGPETTTEVDQIESVIRIIQGYAMYRERFYRGLPTFRYFGKDWTNRTNNIQMASAKMVLTS